MELEIEPTPTGARLRGEMTVYSAATLKPVLLENTQTEGDLEIDLSGISEFDSAGLQLLLMLKRLPNSRTARITGASQVVMAALALCRLEHLVEPQSAVETQP